MFTKIKNAFTSPKGAKSRLVITALFALLGILLTVSATFEKLSFQAVLEFPFALATVVGIFGLCAWCICKWFSLMGRRPIRWAAAFWRSFLPLNVFTLLLKVYGWMVIILVSYLIPTTIIGGLISALAMGAIDLMLTSSFLGILLLVAAGAASCFALYFVVKTDIRSLQAMTAET